MRVGRRAVLSDRGSTLVVATRGDAASAVRISANIVARWGDGPVLIIRNGAAASGPAWDGLAQLPQVSVVDRPGGGVSRARNAALDIATTRVVVFVDDDVIVSEDAVRTIVDRLRSSRSTIATARVVSAAAAHDPLFDTDLGFDRGTTSTTWRTTTGNRPPISPPNAWQFGVGAMFAVDRTLLDAGETPVRFDERLSNGSFCGGSEDIDFFYSAYLAGHTLSYVADAVVAHLFPDSAAAVSAKCRQYALADGAFYGKWASHVTGADLRGEIAGWRSRLRKRAADRAHGRPAMPLRMLLAEPIHKLIGGVTWAVWRLRGRPSY